MLRRSLSCPATEGSGDTGADAAARGIADRVRSWRAFGRRRAARQLRPVRAAAINEVCRWRFRSDGGGEAGRGGDSAHREAVVHGQTGLLVPPGDAVSLASAIRAIAGSPTIGRDLGTAGRRRAAAEFSSAAMVLRVADIYDELLA